MDKKEGKEYRTTIGFSNKNNLKKFFKFTDVSPIVNWEKIEQSNKRLADIFHRINETVSEDTKQSNIDIFCKKIETAYNIMKQNNIIEKLNNQGREPDDVYYNWMRGYLVCEYFISSISKLFGVEENKISIIGQDDLKKIETFARTATADFELKNLRGKDIRLEIQSGYTGINDIKLSKIHEAKQQYEHRKIESYIIHFDLFNGFAAVVNITDFYKIPESAYHKAFENTDVLKIKDEWFKWNLMKKLPYLADVVIKYSPKLLASAPQ